MEDEDVMELWQFQRFFTPFFHTHAEEAKACLRHCQTLTGACSIDICGSVAKSKGGMWTAHLAS